MKKIAVIGGGAAGFFAAIRIAEQRTDYDITIYEKSPNVLGKVRISGGGRCNVTHHCFNPKELVKFYPRGEKQLIGPFNKFGPADTVNWFKARGVTLKTELDGRMFPITDDSLTIIQCLMDSALSAKVKIRTKSGLVAFKQFQDSNGGWEIVFLDGTTTTADILILATGSSDVIWKQLKQLNIAIHDPAPSLFTFNIRDKRIYDLPGLVVKNTVINIVGTKLSTNGPLLVTHWGLSGPGILKLSSWGAILLKEWNYKFKIKINYLPEENEETVFSTLNIQRDIQPKKLLVNTTLFEEIPKRLWFSLISAAGISETKNWSDVNKKELRKLSIELTGGIYEIDGKSTNKDEFVTCGGIDLNEIDFKTMALKNFNTIYVCGEIINVDALTGGFNFQNAWTTGWIAGSAIAEGN